jgi:hypothetical protein
MPNNTYRIKIDNEEAAKGSLYEDWEFEAPKQIRVRRGAAPALLCNQHLPAAASSLQRMAAMLLGLVPAQHAWMIVSTWGASRACVSKRPVTCP